jgi:uncharacterized protein YbaR (Trm112 family)
MMSTIAEATRVGWQEDFWRCVNCGDSARASATGEMLACDACGRTYPITDDLLIVHDQISANNVVHMVLQRR